MCVEILEVINIHVFIFTYLLIVDKPIEINGTYALLCVINYLVMIEHFLCRISK